MEGGRVVPGCAGVAARRLIVPAHTQPRLENCLRQLSGPSRCMLDAARPFNPEQVDKENMQFSYIDGDEHVFMNMETFEEERIPTADIDKRDFIKEEDNLQVLMWRCKAIDVQVRHALGAQNLVRGPPAESRGRADPLPYTPAARPPPPLVRRAGSASRHMRAHTLHLRDAGAEDCQHEGRGGGAGRQRQHCTGPR